MKFQKEANDATMEHSLKKRGSTNIETFSCLNNRRVIAVVRSTDPSGNNGALEMHYSVSVMGTVPPLRGALPRKINAEELVAFEKFFNVITSECESIDNGDVLHMFFPITPAATQTAAEGGSK